MTTQKNTNWIIPATISDDVNRELKDFPYLIRQILFNRKIHTTEMADAFLRADKPEYDPFLFNDINIAVRLIHDAVNSKKKIVVFGDYDVDGVTASALLYQVLQRYDADVQVFIPNRFDEGYGLTMDALTAVLELKPGLIITVDCGVRSIKEVEAARSQNVDVIITDHHQPFDVLPEANAVICPKQKDDSYPFKGLAGVGIAYKLAQCLLEEYPLPNVSVDEWIDLVAVGTIADLAPLNDENRTLVRRGLRTIRFAKRPGLLALANVSGTNIHKMKAEDIGFRIGPRLNAAGRLGSADLALNLLLAETTKIAGDLALKLDEENRKRQKITREIQNKVQGLYDPERNAWMLFFWDKDFHEGVVGLTASRLVEQYYRPTIIGVEKNGIIRASCRSIPEMNVTSVLDECSEFLLQHGGHSMAAGLSVTRANIEPFINKFDLVCKRNLVKAEREKGQPLMKEIHAAAEITLKELLPEKKGKLPEYFGSCDILEPLGNENPAPLFVVRNVNCKSIKKVGQSGDHLKLNITDGNIIINAIAFNFGYLFEEAIINDPVDILFSYELNEYNGRKSLQLNIIDFEFYENEHD